MTMPPQPPPQDPLPPTGAPYPPPYPGAYGPVFSQQSEVSSKKLAAGLCALLIGSLGIHKFVLGYTTAGMIMLLVTVLTCGLGAVVMHVIAIVEGILYLSKSDAEFYQTYMVNKKEWF